MWYRNLQHADLPYPTVGEGWVIHNGEWMLQSMLRGTPTSRPFRHGDSARNVSGPYTPMTPQQMGLTTPPPTPPDDEEEIGGEEGLQRLVQTLGFKLYAPKFHVPRHPGMARAYGVAGRRVAVAGRTVGGSRGHTAAEALERIARGLFEEAAQQTARRGARRLGRELTEEALESGSRRLIGTAIVEEFGEEAVEEALQRIPGAIDEAAEESIEEAVQRVSRDRGQMGEFIEALEEGTRRQFDPAAMMRSAQVRGRLNSDDFLRAALSPNPRVPSPSRPGRPSTVVNVTPEIALRNNPSVARRLAPFLGIPVAGVTAAVVVAQVASYIRNQPPSPEDLATICSGSARSAELQAKRDFYIAAEVIDADTTGADCVQKILAYHERLTRGPLGDIADAAKFIIPALIGVLLLSRL